MPPSYLRRRSAIDSDVVADPSAPVSPPDVLRLAFTPDIPRDTEPGVFRWWVDGTLNGDHRAVILPRCCFEQFEFTPTRQFPPLGMEYMYIDHTTVRAR